MHFIGETADLVAQDLNGDGIHGSEPGPSQIQMHANPTCRNGHFR
jgi:hypothetical protein